MKPRARQTSVVLAIVLQLAPMARQVITEITKFTPNIAVIFRWGVGLSALLGGIDAVSGASQGHVIVAPKISAQPASLAVAPGKTVRFTVHATGSRLTYQWLFNNQPIPGATRKSLALHNIQAANAGNYKVVIRNPAGVTTSAPATLTVNAAAALLRAPATNGNSLPIFVPVPGSGVLVGQAGVTAGQITGNFSWLGANGTTIPLTVQSIP